RRKRYNPNRQIGRWTQVKSPVVVGFADHAWSTHDCARKRLAGVGRHDRSGYMVFAGRQRHRMKRGIAGLPRPSLLGVLLLVQDETYAEAWRYMIGDQFALVVGRDRRWEKRVAEVALEIQPV